MNDAGFFAANPTDFSMVQNLKLDLDYGVILEDPSLFRRLMAASFILLLLDQIWCIQFKNCVNLSLIPVNLI